MPYSTLISVADAARALSGQSMPVLLDCSSELTDPDAGLRAYAAGHLPGAHHVSLQATLSGVRTGTNGRNPLPDPKDFVRAMAALGIGNDTQVIAYDNGGGLYAARLWWMLRWVGHRAVAVLDGGVAAWKAAGWSLTPELPPVPAPGTLTQRAPWVAWVDYERLRDQLAQGRCQVLDARASDRFRGENETLDPRAGHIPGARNRPFRDNLQADGRFKPAATLRAEFQTLLGQTPAQAVVHQCGSGVSACHNLLALEVAGLSGGCLYAGSWSEWCARPESPIALGPA